MEIQIELSEPERSILLAGINEWGGPAALTDELARAIGFVDRDDLFSNTMRLRGLLKAQSPMETWDWVRVLVMTEFVFVSDVFGSGVEWSITTGFQDDETIGLLRTLQRKFAKVGAHRQQFSP